MKRYQNPEIYEPLAMSYVLGTLTGRARERFEALLGRHAFLQATVESYQARLHGMVEYLPEEPAPDRVWQGIAAKVGADVEPSLGFFSQLKANFEGWLNPTKYAAAVMSIVAVLFVTWQLALNPVDNTSGYYSQLTAADTNKVLVKVTGDASDQSLTVMLTEALNQQVGKVPTLWCLSKDPSEAPIRMGVIAAVGETHLKLSSAMWHGLKNVRAFAISLESNHATSPSNPFLIEGVLQRI